MALPITKQVPVDDKLYTSAGSVESGENQESLKQLSVAVEEEDCTRPEEMLSHAS